MSEKKTISYPAYNKRVQSIEELRNMIDTFDRSPDDKTGVYAEAGVGRARAEYSVFEAEDKGLNASAGAEVACVHAQAGPVGVKAGLGFNTGAAVGRDGVEVKVLGTGISIGKKNSVSVLGNEASCSVM